MLPGRLLLDEFERGDNEKYHCTMEDLVPDSLGCLYVDCSSSAFIPLSHKGHALVLGSHILCLRCRLSISGPLLHSLEFCLNHLVTMASLFQSSTSLDVSQVV